MKKLVSSLCFLMMLFCFAPLASAESGTPVEIYDRAGLEDIANDPWGSYILCADIDLGDTTWVPFDFFGRLDGNGHTIYNLHMTEPGRSVHTTVDGNHKEYPTVFASLFSGIKDAEICDLSLKGVVIDASCEQNCFAAAIAGFSENSTLVNCSAEGMISLDCKGKMCGVGGLVGFGSCEFENCSVDMILSVADMVEGQDCEEFLGGILACGYGNITKCSVKLRAFASVYGYVHNGAVVGMHHVHTKEAIYCIMKNCTVDAEISFFEKVESRRAYCSSTVGENLHKDCITDRNKITHYRQKESEDTNSPLLPESCSSPTLEQTIVPLTETEWGYTVHSCNSCGFFLVRDYTAPVIPIKGIELNKTELKLLCNESQSLCAAVSPQNATESELIYTSSNPEIAKVYENGIVLGVAPGEAVITCSSATGSVQAQCFVTVRFSFAQWIHHYILFGWLSD